MKKGSRREKIGEDKGKNNKTNYTRLCQNPMCKYQLHINKRGKNEIEKEENMKKMIKEKKWGGKNKQMREGQKKKGGR